MSQHELPQGIQVIGVQFGDGLLGLFITETLGRVAISLQKDLEVMDHSTSRIARMSPEGRATFEEAANVTIADLRAFTLELFNINIFYLERMLRELDPENAPNYGVSAEDVIQVNEERTSILAALRERRDEFALQTAQPLGSDA